VTDASLPTATGHLPLAGVRVLDLTRALAGPFCTMLLGDLGADVLKVEPLEGEFARRVGPWQGDVSLYFISSNRNKRSLALDMWSPDGREVLRTLAAHVDVVVENFRPGVLDALGLGSEWCAEQLPHLIVTSVSGFGHVGPRANEPCYDQVALGMAGLMSVSGTEESGPMRSGIPLADTLTGMFAALGVCAALAGRQVRTVHTSLLESAIGVLTLQGQRYLSLGEVPGPAGNDHPIVVPYGVFRTATQSINLAVGTPQQLSALCEIVGEPGLDEDPRFSTPQARLANKTVFVDRIQQRLMQRDAAHWLAAFAAAHIPCGPINDMAEVFAEEQVTALGIVEQVEHPVLVSVPMARGPLWFDGVPAGIRRAAPELGEHSLEILAECGLDAAVVEDLRARGIVGVADLPGSA